MDKSVLYNDFTADAKDYQNAIEASDLYMSEPNLPFMACTYRHMGAPLHWHHYWEILCQIEGTTRIRVGNEVFLSEKGDITIIGSDSLHSTQKITEEHCLLILQFQGSLLTPYMKEIEQFKYLSNIIFEQMGTKQHFHIKNNEYIHSLLEKTLLEYGEKQLGYEMQIQAYLMQMFAYFLREQYISITNIDVKKVEALDKVKKSLIYLENNFKKNITLEELASVSCMSVYHFCRTFKVATDGTCIEYLNYIRIREAEKLLLLTDCSISKIAMDLGFSSVSYFNRVFKKKNGISPQIYRKQNSTNTKQEKNSFAEYGEL